MSLTLFSRIGLFHAARAAQNVLIYNLCIRMLEEPSSSLHLSARTCQGHLPGGFAPEVAWDVEDY